MSVGGIFFCLICEDLGGLVQELWPLDRGVPCERLDDGEALVAGRRRVATFGFEPVQEREYPSPVEVGETQLLGWGCLHVAKPGEQQFDRVPVGRDSPRRGCALPGQMVDEEPGQPASREVFWTCALRGHDCPSSAAGMTYPNRSCALAITSG